MAWKIRIEKLLWFLGHREPKLIFLYLNKFNPFRPFSIIYLASTVVDTEGNPSWFSRDVIAAMLVSHEQKISN
jgi:hypothetical protein